MIIKNNIAICIPGKVSREKLLLGHTLTNHPEVKKCQSSRLQTFHSSQYDVKLVSRASAQPLWYINLVIL